MNDLAVPTNISIAINFEAGAEPKEFVVREPDPSLPAKWWAWWYANREEDGEEEVMVEKEEEVVVDTADAPAMPTPEQWNAMGALQTKMIKKVVNLEAHNQHLTEEMEGMKQSMSQMLGALMMMESRLTAQMDDVKRAVAK